jgi:hypothetical protein
MNVMKKWILAAGFLIILALAAGLGLSGQVSYPNWMNINSTLCYLGQSCTVTASGGGTTTNPLTMNNSGSGAASGTTFNGSTAETLSYNTIGAAPASTVINSGTANQFAYYSATGTAVSGNANLTDNGTVLTAGEPLVLGPTASSAYLKYNALSSRYLEFQAYNTSAAEVSDITQDGSNGSIYLDYNNSLSGSFNIRNNFTGGTTQFSISGGTTTISTPLTLSGLTNAATGDYVCYNAGVIEYNTATCTLSLRKYKMNIHPLFSSLREVMQLKPVSYQYKPEVKLGSRSYLGFIAEDVAKVDPRAAAYKDNGELESVDYERMTALLAAAIQEQQKEITILKKQIKKLEKQ